MRNWYSGSESKSTYIQSVGHYLWGIDTKSISTKSISGFSFKSDITYEELIQIYQQLSLFCFSLCNRRTLPMRNWYKFLLGFYMLKYLRSDITYEELIRVIRLSLKIESINLSDITYEELIQPLPSCKDSNRDSSIVGPYLWGIDIRSMASYFWISRSDITFPTRIPCANT